MSKKNIFIPYNFLYVSMENFNPFRVENQYFLKSSIETINYLLIITLPYLHLGSWKEEKNPQNYNRSKR